MGKILTVSIAGYNIETFIDTCLEPFADNVFIDDLEVLIIDDGSTDNTREKAMKYVDEYSSIFKYIHKENGGWGSTVNCGVANATGKYFKQLDGDDYFEKSNLMQYLSFLQSATEDIIFTNFAKFRNKSHGPFDITNYSTSFVSGKKYLFEDIIDTSLIPVQMHALTIKTTLLKDNYDSFKISEHCFYTDVEYWIKAICFAESFSYFDTVIYMYRIGLYGQSISKAGIQKHYKEHLKVLKKCLWFLDNTNLNGVKKEILQERLKGMAADQYIFYLCLPITKQNKKALRDYDRWLKQYYINLVPNGWKRYEILNKSAFVLYPVAAKIVQKSME